MHTISVKKEHTLPEPSDAEKAQSKRLCAEIRNLIHAAGGAIPFSDFMSAALFSPNDGYYSSLKSKIGRAGDFVTAPELSPLFSECLAIQLAEVLAHVPSGHVLEFGAGTGRMAGDILHTLVTEKNFRGQYYILEPSGALRAEQVAYLSDRFPGLFSRFVWLNTLPAQFTGVILANEVLDAFPVERFAIKAGRLYRTWVEADPLQPDGFIQIDRPNDLPLLSSVFEAQAWPEAYRSECHPQLSAWLQSLGEVLNEGVLFVLDYGFPKQTYYHTDRSSGTLMCHYKHYAHTDPFFYPGLQDITAHIDFSALADAANQTGWQGLGYTDQAHFLINLGLLTRLERQLGGDKHLSDLTALKAIQGVQTLLSPSEMGELFKVIALGKNLSQEIPLSGFTTKNRYAQLRED